MSDIVLLNTEIPDLLPMRDRSKGVHVSAIVRRICIERGIWDEQTEIDPSRLMLGRAFEYALIEMHKRDNPTRYFTPPELLKDNIYGHIDLCDAEDQAVEEIKLTERSSKHGSVECQVGESPSMDHPIRGIDFCKDWIQLKAYCYMFGWSKGRLKICHPRGDYRGFKVVYNVWEKVFTRNELIENWLTMRTYAKGLDNEES